MKNPLSEHAVWESVPEQSMHPGGLSLIEWALAFCNLSSGARALDLGCGTGATLRHLSAQYGLTGFGVDVSAALLMRARQAGRGVSFAQAQSEQLPLMQGSMDVVISECTLSIFDVEKALKEGARVLKPGGYWVISDLYARNQIGIYPLRQTLAGTCFRSILGMQEIFTGICSAGLRILAWQDCSEQLKDFPLCTLFAAIEIDPFELVIAAQKAKLGYYFILAQKG